MRLVPFLAALVATSAASTARAQDAAPAGPLVNADRPRETSSGFMLGASLSHVAPGTIPLSGDLALSAGEGLGVSAGYRAKYVYLGLAYNHSFLGGGSWEHESTMVQTFGASSDYFGVDVCTFTSPDSLLSFFTHFGLGYRVLNATVSNIDGSTPASVQAAGNLDVTLAGIGLAVRAGDHLRFVAEGSAEVGPYAVYANLTLTAYFELPTPSSVPAPSKPAAAPKPVAPPAPQRTDDHWEPEVRFERR
jgi:hypothetical protein